MDQSATLMKRFDLRYPIIQAPLAGGGDTPELVAAVCNAGGMGFIGAAYLTPEHIRIATGTVRKLTTRPFGVNLFAPMPTETLLGSAEAAIDQVGPYFQELGLLAPGLPVQSRYTFEDQLDAALESGASAFSFTFGILSDDVVAAIKRRDMFLIGTATTVAEAAALEKAGVDGIVAQGSEAGGHRGTFSGDFSAGMIGTIALVPQIVDAVHLPVIASGGIMDGRGIAAALALGAAAVQLGTAFLSCHESGIPPVYKDAILNAREDQTRITRAFSGRPARGIVNRFMTEVESTGAILPFPLQNALTRPLRSAAGKQGRSEFLSLWAGQGVRLARRQSAAELVARLGQETDMTLRKLVDSRERGTQQVPSAQ